LAAETQFLQPKILFALARFNEAAALWLRKPRACTSPSRSRIPGFNEAAALWLRKHPGAIDSFYVAKKLQ